MGFLTIVREKGGESKMKVSSGISYTAKPPKYTVAGKHRSMKAG